ncbi:chemotaxis protein CheC [Clostridium sp. BJN0001]|uniref:chemotaxis protein CheC n=1 Tax=Clostridium sp. BJN0001 TaxID=2930219 RepID=UPI001FD333D2|nr:chemotaxis protein CheC [Clostridium sp. BJN0001]
MDNIELNTMQLDALKEVSNIGAGNAATSLSMLLGKTIDMTVPAVNIISLQDIFDQNGEDLVCGIIVRVLGSIEGNVLIVFDKETAEDIVKRLTNGESEITSDMGQSVLCEIANIISGSYMNAIAKLTNLLITPSVPAVSYDMLGAILSTSFIEADQYDEQILDIETVFLNQNKENIGGHFYYIPKPGSLDKILKSIGIN